MRPLSMFMSLANQTALNRIKPGFAHICKRYIADVEEKHSSLVNFVKAPTENIMYENFPRITEKKILSLVTSEVVQFDIQDIELEESHKYGKILLSSKDDITVRYGEKGIMPSSSTLPLDLLKHDLIIPSKTFGILAIQKHVPFKLDIRDENTLFLPFRKIAKMLPYEKNIKRYWFDSLTKNSDSELYNRIANVMKNEILKSGKVESFFDETTAPFIEPTKDMNSSLTGMIFDGEFDKTSPMHYHPGWRFLHIVTTDIPSGVLLNFCGIEEDPSERRDTMVKINFPLNSFSRLSFPPYVHHKFFGKFVCSSDHPSEGPIFLESYLNKTIYSDKGFLEANTSFSKVSNPEILLDHIKWDISRPEFDSRNDKSNSRSL